MTVTVNPGHTDLTLLPAHPVTHDLYADVHAGMIHLGSKVSLKNWQDE